MSDTIWTAVLAGKTTLRVWSVFETGEPSPSDTVPRSALADMSGSVIAAGLDVPARSVPGKPLTSLTHAPGLTHVAAIPMLRQETPAALTQGAETAIAGYLQGNPSFDGVLLIVGEETCWAHISAEEVVSFQTFLSAQIAQALDASDPTLGPAFEDALDETLSRPDRLAQHLASANAAGTGQIWAHLIGAEIASAKPYWLGQRIVILADGSDGAPYAKALELQAAMVEHADLTEAYLTGFTAAWNLVTAQSSN